VSIARDPFASVIDERVPETTTELADRCVSIALCFRFGLDAEGHAAMPSAIAGLERALHAEVLSPEAAAPVVAAMLAAIEQQDLLLVADLLELVIAPSLR
jgi:cobalamin biosynthesis protein CbiG